LSGFVHLTVLDLDTIDVSNLNRQFLFRRPHVGLSKAKVAVEAVIALYPPTKATLVPLHDNIKNSVYDHDFFAQFDLVMNALDNLEARRHVNRLCLSAGRVLLESGTQGYAGQTTVIEGGATECFECQPVPTPKTFAVCTIRNTPDKPIHCIVWAKSVFQAVFGPEEEGGIMQDLKVDVHAAVEQEREAAATAAKSASATASGAAVSAFARSLFDKLFNEEIRKQCEVKERWANRTAPVPLDLDALLASLNTSSTAAFPSPLTPAYFRSRDHSVLSVAENALYLLTSLRSLLLSRTSELGTLVFDKDDEDALDFVTALSNLRMNNFHIAPLHSRFSIKGLAGNIVHAIATTNAIAAGLMVAEAVKILDGKREQCHTTWITRRGPALLAAQKLNEPNPACFVCAHAHTTQELQLDTNTWTLKRLYAQVLRGKLSMNEPSIDVINRESVQCTVQRNAALPAAHLFVLLDFAHSSFAATFCFVCFGAFPPVSSNFIGTEEDHEEDEGDDGDGEESAEGGGAAAAGSTYLTKPLSSAGVRIDHGALLAVEDQQQKLSVQIRIVQRAQWDEEKEPDGFLLLQGKGASAAVTSAAAANSNAEDAATPVAALMEESKEAPAAPAASSAAPSSAASASISTSHKRKQPSFADADVIDADVAEEADGTAAKRAKGASGAPVAAPAVDADSDVIELD
jgi:ubiquitin-like 1-activating enzyme E1 B